MDSSALNASITPMTTTVDAPVPTSIDAPVASTTPVVSPVADEPVGFPIPPAPTLVRQNAIVASSRLAAPTITPTPVVGGASAMPLSRCWAYTEPPPRSRIIRSPNVYIRIWPDSREFDIALPDEVEDEAGKTAGEIARGEHRSHDAPKPHA